MSSVRQRRSCVPSAHRGGAVCLVSLKQELCAYVYTDRTEKGKFFSGDFFPLYSEIFSLYD